MRAEHTAGGGRPLITVSEDYANLPDITLPVAFPQGFLQLGDLVG
jgi:hypothetical protein